MSIQKLVEFLEFSIENQTILIEEYKDIGDWSKWNKGYLEACKDMKQILLDKIYD